MCVCVCVCLCVRGSESKRERERRQNVKWLFLSLFSPGRYCCERLFNIWFCVLLKAFFVAGGGGDFQGILQKSTIAISFFILNLLRVFYS